MHCLANVVLFGLLGFFRAGGCGRGAIQYCIAGSNIEGSSEGPAASINQINQTESPKEILMLPPSVGVEGDGEISRTINLGETISLEELGPIIINADGTTRRITNWSTLSKAEQESSWRVISARNLKRLKVLQKKRAEEVSTADEVAPPTVETEETVAATDSDSST